MADQMPKKKILLVEDDVFMIDLLVHELVGAGFEVAVSKSGKDGFDKFKSEKPDLMLLDILLPDENGLELLRRIRREPNGPELKVVMLSNLSESSEIDEAKRLGALAYLVKANSSLQDIVATIQHVLGLSGG